MNRTAQMIPPPKYYDPARPCIGDLVYADSVPVAGRGKSPAPPKAKSVGLEYAGVIVDLLIPQKSRHSDGPLAYVRRANGKIYTQRAALLHCTLSLVDAMERRVRRQGAAIRKLQQITDRLVEASKKNPDAINSKQAKRFLEVCDRLRRSMATKPSDLMQKPTVKPTKRRRVPKRPLPPKIKGSP